MAAKQTHEHPITFQIFVRLPLREQLAALRRHGVKFDSFNHKGETTFVYYLNDFFVEEIYCAQRGHFKDLIPFKTGYRVRNRDHETHIFIKESTDNLQTFSNQCG